MCLQLRHRRHIPAQQPIHLPLNKRILLQGKEALRGLFFCEFYLRNSVVRLPSKIIAGLWKKMWKIWPGVFVHCNKVGATWQNNLLHIRK
jgi:hypothetical protein